MVAYLVIREGSLWTDVFRLVEGESVTVGRAPTNQIVIKDERCSRNHVEVFFDQSRWMLRDLDSRNGTTIDGQRLQQDYSLQPGDIFRIGNTHLAFVHDLSTAFPEALDAPWRRNANPEEETFNGRLDDSHILSEADPHEITLRTGRTKFLSPPTEPIEDDTRSLPKVGRAAAMLCRLAFEMAQATDAVSLANLALAGLCESTLADAGAVLLLPRGKEDPAGNELEIVASRSETEYSYHRVSRFLASTVLREGEGVLARNVIGDSTLGTRDSKGEIHTTSVICVPLRNSGIALGLVHLYSTDGARILDPDDLEFTLAVADTLAVALANLSRRQELAENLTQIRDENVQLLERLGVQSEIVGNSRVMMDVARQIGQAAPSRATVLIRGESGVGKELVARAVHFSSPRRKSPFICLNCAALTETLLESELFGHERGAFTGATERKVGKFEAAHKGTLMLDEIGEMSPNIQAKFLRVLEGHPFERVGGSEQIKVDVRVIAATNRDLERDVAERRFRRDLYFRLRVLEVIVPGLRKRPEDIPELAEYFLGRFNAETGRRIRGYTSRALDEMLRYRWPGNVRELKNVVERAVVLCRGEMIDLEDLALSRLSTAGDTGDLGLPGQGAYQPLSLEEVESRHILATLNETGWNKSQAAVILGIERSTLDRKIRRYSLPDPRGSSGDLLPPSAARE
jgi:Nif-specific regulatory protein